MDNTQEKTTNSTLVAKVEPLMVRASQAAELCNVSVRQWHSMRAAGLCPPSIKINGCRLWSVQIIRQWVAMGCPATEKFEKLQNVTKNN